MSASRKLYVAMAERLKAAKPSVHLGSDPEDGWEMAVLAVARAFASDNSGFDMTKFLKAAGIEPNYAEVVAQHM